jgi:hypothetical protein
MFIEMGKMYPALFLDAVQRGPSSLFIGHSMACFKADAHDWTWAHGSCGNGTFFEISC